MRDDGAVLHPRLEEGDQFTSDVDSDIAGDVENKRFTTGVASAFGNSFRPCTSNIAKSEISVDIRVLC